MDGANQIGSVLTAKGLTLKGHFIEGGIEMIKNLKEDIENLMQEHSKTWDDVLWYGTEEEYWPMDMRDIWLDVELFEGLDELRSDFVVVGNNWKIHVVYTSKGIDEDGGFTYEQNLRLWEFPKKPEKRNDSPWLWRDLPSVKNIGINDAVLLKEKEENNNGRDRIRDADRSCAGDSCSESG